MSVLPEKQAGIEIFSCNDDYVSFNSIRLCGEKLNDASRNDDLTLNAEVIDMTNGPNFIPVHTNDAVVGRGFRLNYKQLLCQESPVMEATEPVPTDITPNNSPISKRKKEIKNLGFG